MQDVLICLISEGKYLSTLSKFYSLMLLCGHTVTCHNIESGIPEVVWYSTTFMIYAKCSDVSYLGRQLFANVV